ncbi:MAG: bile acid:sodium symporter [Desulfosalsimonas sp.]
MVELLKKYWFLWGLAAVFAATLLDPTGGLAAFGRWLKLYNGADGVIFLIFFFSGLLLDPQQIRAGVSDISGTIVALVLIFAVAPLLAAAAALLPMSTGIATGLFLVAVMPTTLSSGVVMSGAAGGNPAHALFITLLANVLCMFTIPATLPLLLDMTGVNASEIVFDRLAVMIKIAFYVIVPLCLGLAVKYLAPGGFKTAGPKLQLVNQCLILCIVWMGVSQALPVLSDDWSAMVQIAGLAALFHLALLGCAFLSVRLLSFPRGRMEQVIFMGSQKTLPLSIILQVTLFPQYGQALMVCVLHHLVSLFMDGFLVGRLRRPEYK